MNGKRLRLLRGAARVRRCHIMPTLHQQTVGEHTFGVLCILTTIYHALSPQLVRAALFHDAPEAKLGDLPAPAKWSNKKLHEAYKELEVKLRMEYDLDEPLTEFEQQLLRFADKLELAMFALEECQDGNVKMAGVFRRVSESIERDKLWNVTPSARDLYAFVQDRFRLGKFPIYGSMHEYIDT